MDIDISIIVPVYNVEKYLEKCIDSILNQTFKEFELILVNDGSKDSSGTICDKYTEKDSRIKVVHKKNGGLSSARNAGLSIAKGKYIGFIDSDDYINKDMYSLLYENIISTNSDIAICGFKKVYSYNDESEDILTDTKICVLNNIEALNMMYSENGVDFVVAWNKLYKRNLFDDLEFKDGKLHEDEFICHQILYKSKQVVYNRTQLYYYLQRSSSIINSDFNAKKLDAIYAFNERKDFFKNKGLKELQYLTEYNYIKYFFEYYFKYRDMLKKSDRDLIKLKIQFSKNISQLIKNPLYNWKEKVLWMIFLVNSNIYKWYTSK